ncbi:eukaryotic translation initiation factor eIF2A-domain-containing protein [Cladochytrium replicatum]|nr:eukaryotic translation initiation factor eIF2A-domain-containing protein [Cladochytrium replicatum]
MPKDPKTGLSKGYMFVEFSSPEQAEVAIKTADGIAMDKKHIIAVNAFDDIGKYANAPEEFKEPARESFVEKDHLRGWLLDERCRDQWVQMRGDEVSICWNNASVVYTSRSDPPEVAHARQNWTDSYVAWSPLGIYLATFHKRGIILWSGKMDEKGDQGKTRFPHPNVKLVDFSPNESHLVTWSHEPIITPKGEQHHIIVWDVRSGVQLRSFPVEPSSIKNEPTGPGARGAQPMKIDWPIFKWSHDDKYLARLSPGTISVYETPSMNLVDKKSIKVEGVVAFNWSPADHIISYWIPEAGNIPARVTLMKMPSREIVRTKNLFNVLDAKMFWQNAGDYLLVKVDRAKSKTKTVTNFEIFRLREKDIPVDVLEIRAEETVDEIFWEPKGNRFAMLTREGTTNAKLFVYFYEVQTAATAAPAAKAAETAAGGIKLLRKFEPKNVVNRVIWSPKGRYCVLAGVSKPQSPPLPGNLEFWDIDEMVLMNAGEHYMATDVEWDPTGRYVASSVSWWHFQNDTGFCIWSFAGQNLVRQNVATLKQFLWRPRPPTLLSKDQMKNIKKKLKDYSTVFDKVDAKAANQLSQEAADKMRRLWNEWQEYRARCAEDYERDYEARVELFGFDPDKPPQNEEEEALQEYVEEVVEEFEEIIS